jgi:hypothetical protein
MLKTLQIADCGLPISVQASDFFNDGLQRKPRTTRERLDGFGLGFGDLPRIHACNTSAVEMNWAGSCCFVASRSLTAVSERSRGSATTTE